MSNVLSWLLQNFGSGTMEDYGTGASQAEMEAARRYANQQYWTNIARGAMTGEWDQLAKFSGEAMSNQAPTYRAALEKQVNTRKQNELFGMEKEKSQRQLQHMIDDDTEREAIKKVVMPAVINKGQSVIDQIKSSTLSEAEKTALISGVQTKLDTFKDNPDLWTHDGYEDLVNAYDSVGKALGQEGMRDRIKQETQDDAVTKGGFVKKGPNGERLPDYEAMDQFQVTSRSLQLENERLQAADTRSRMSDRAADNKRQEENDKLNKGSVRITSVVSEMNRLKAAQATVASVLSDKSEKSGDIRREHRDELGKAMAILGLPNTKAGWNDAIKMDENKLAEMAMRSIDIANSALQNSRAPEAGNQFSNVQAGQSIQAEEDPEFAALYVLSNKYQGNLQLMAKEFAKRSGKSEAEAIEYIRSVIVRNTKNTQ